MARRKGKKRTLSEEQLKKLKEGRERKKVHAKRMSELKDLEKRLYIGSRQ